uniref:Uncharacterized protein n=1 Tax=Arundo donax TaxID=35708 RepID=A0A0A8Z5S0_ARUDO
MHFVRLAKDEIIMRSKPYTGSSDAGPSNTAVIASNCDGCGVPCGISGVTSAVLFP